MYQFARVLFGLKVAGSALLRALKQALDRGSPKMKGSLKYYMDDLLIGSKTFQEHMNVLNELFTIMSDFNFTLNLKKCKFFKNEVIFLGFIISNRGVEANPEKIYDIQNFETPRDKKQLQAFLGMYNYYRRFCLKYSDFIEPFRELLREGSTWNWDSKYSKTFVALKENFIRAVCLNHIMPDKIFKVQTDASEFEIGGVLYQIDDENNQRIISVASRCLTQTESNYTTTERELLAIVYTIYKFRYYLIGVTFQVITDHKGLTFLESTVYHNSRLIRWSLLLQQFSFNVKYCKGTENIVADFLSRNPEGKFAEQQENKIVMAALNMFCSPSEKYKNINSLVIMAIKENQECLKSVLKNVAERQRKDKNLNSIIESIEKNEENIDKCFVYKG